MDENSRSLDIPDVSDWTSDEFTQAPGIRRKLWLMEPGTGTRALFKIPKDNTGEAWGEQVTCALGRRLGFDTANTKIAVYNRQLGSLSENFVSLSEELFQGGDLLSLSNAEFDRSRLAGYDIGAILTALETVELDRDFLSIPVFDALVANQDRHCDNWGVIRDANGSYRLAPLYDSGCSLGHLIPESALDSFFRDKQRTTGFMRQGKSMIGLPGAEKPKFLALLSHIRKRHEADLKPWIERVASMRTEHSRAAVNDIPDDLMSEKRKEFTCKLLSLRQTWLIDWWKGQT